MKTPLEQKLRQAKRRCTINLLLECLAWAALACGGAIALAVTAERLLAPGWMRPWMLAPAGGVAVVAALVAWILRRPAALAVAVLVDERLALRERFSTALAFSGSDDPFARAACADAQSAASAAKLREHFPIAPTPRWAFALIAWVLAAMAWLLVPPLDLSGWASSDAGKKAAEKSQQEAVKKVQQETAKVEMAVRNINDPELSKDLGELSKLSETEKSDDMKRQAIKKLDDLASKLQQSENNPKLQTYKAMENLLKELRGSKDGLDQKLNQDLARGQFSQAQALLQKMKEQMEKGELTEQQKEALAKQLEDLSKQIDNLAQQDKPAQDALKQAGLDDQQAKELAQASPEDLRKALEKAGLSKEQIDKILEQMQQNQQACKSCQGLANALGQAGRNGRQISADDLAKLISQMQDGESMELDLAAREAALDEIRQAMGNLGQGMCPGGNCNGENQGMLAGGTGDWKPGDPTGRPGGGSGGPGQGSGARPTDDTGDVSHTKTLAPSQVGEGPSVASWYFKGPQVKGETRKELQDKVAAARDSAAEAINENEIPKKYESTVKKYFGDLDGESKK